MAGDVAMPDEFVTTVALEEPENKPPAPKAGESVNETEMPATPVPPVFVTDATNGAEKAAPTKALCGVPETAVMAVGPEPLPTVKVCDALFVVPATSVAVAMIVCDPVANVDVLNVA